MSGNVCRSVLMRNYSSLSVSNRSNISEVQWITNSISLVICFVAIVGNVAALFVMFTSRGSLRLKKDKYLVNLAFADLLRACSIPFTVIARIKRNFIFGRTLCQVLPIIQGVSVSVDAFTLVCISIGRYFAICHPFVLVKLQTMSYSSIFSALTLILIWMLGLVIALPNFFMHDLCFLPTLRRWKCERNPLELLDERIYMIIVDVAYFVIPMIVMLILYTLVMIKMSEKNTATRMRASQNSVRSTKRGQDSLPPMEYTDSSNSKDQKRTISGPHPHCKTGRRHKSKVRMDRERRRALKLLIVLIVEFFICWIPLYVYHTIGIFHKAFYRLVPPVVLDLILLFSFASASSNPLTYYFLSKRYRAVLYEILNSFCRKSRQSQSFSQQQRPLRHATIALGNGREKAFTARRLKSNPV